MPPALGVRAGKARPAPGGPPGGVSRWKLWDWLAGLGTGAAQVVGHLPWDDQCGLGGGWCRRRSRSGCLAVVRLLEEVRDPPPRGRPTLASKAPRSKCQVQIRTVWL